MHNPKWFKQFEDSSKSYELYNVVNSQTCISVCAKYFFGAVKVECLLRTPDSSDSLNKSKWQYKGWPM